MTWTLHLADYFKLILDGVHTFEIENISEISNKNKYLIVLVASSLSLPPQKQKATGSTSILSLDGFAVSFANISNEMPRG